ncbi:uncharacterized protein CANTADRAFT_26599 [Suhomyces tanzawaensis NRRL Y-17324]|uniref:Uncharacterized protein n=1 Tax=Suhomyces tanzawaensis NRRL Y-17324 TaxID=984487 RepID=A0A1E4SGA9_9ASCO|nr:uncharacterized protein CANTADRAFT_26599 [Suhomyces tanzawaensis NRRL Y-17324]ODV78548.1 hypothetical protein CANTADRAFT_26599 [Suhomyces tanzawaensis NRRL Y-17324]
MKLGSCGGWVLYFKSTEPLREEWLVNLRTYDYILFHHEINRAVYHTEALDRDFMK